MKKIHLTLIGAGIVALATGCSHEEFFVTEGEGSLLLKTTVNTDMKVVSRSVEQDLIDSCMVWISSEKGLVRRYDSYSDIPTEPIPLVCGHYVAEAWTGDSVPASWESRWFKGVQDFDIVAGETAHVELQCNIANVGAEVNYAEGLEDYLRDFNMTIGHKGGSLLFEGRETRCGYFMMPSFDKDLAYELTGKQLDGSDFSYSGVIVGAKPGYKYRFNITYTPSDESYGGGVLDVEIDEEEFVEETEVVLIAPPKFIGYNFDINSPLMAEEQGLGRRSVYVTSATRIDEVELSGNAFDGIDALRGNSFELLGLSENAKALVEAAGINYKYTYDAANDETIMQINFEKSFTDTLKNGEYSITFKATDKDGRVATTTLMIVISNAPVITSSATNISYFSATLRATASKADVVNPGFKYRKEGDTEWISVPGSALSSSLEYTADLTGLVDRTTYEYVATSEGFESTEVVKFTTLSAQLPNCGFEEWSKYNNAVILCNDYSSVFWDTGNHGSKTLQSTQVTTQSTTIKHSGSSAACLKSQFVGVGTLGQFAAGNVFVGQYLDTDGTNGVLGWGRPFTFQPKTVRVWVKYTPAPSVNKKGAGDLLPVGTMDQGIIYIALVDDTKTEYKGTYWPCVVKTKTAELFDKNGANVIAYGEYIFDKATDGDTLIPIDIPLKYYEGKNPADVKNIIFVASASRYGDYFQGGDGSLMYLDDVELLY